MPVDGVAPLADRSTNICSIDLPRHQLDQNVVEQVVPQLGRQICLRWELSIPLAANSHEAVADGFPILILDRVGVPVLSTPPESGFGRGRERLSLKPLGCARKHSQTLPRGSR
jgi:hypothetical protein